ncbi:MAG: peptide ABC transporter substrate-binding protein [Firmicutes bacterium]|nr:peptide ABC transporter substrate-binding protein [Bacillota bacterium]
MHTFRVRTLATRTAAGFALLAATMMGTGAPAVAASHATSQGGVIIDGLYEEPGNLNPILGPDETFSQIVQTSIFRNLLMATPNNVLVPDLATQVPTVANGGISKDGLVYTFHIKPSARWSNGQPVTSRDVWITWKLINNPKVNAVSKLGWDDIKVFDILNNKTFRITLRHPNGALLANAFSHNLPGILPYSVFGHMSPAAVNTASFNHDPSVSDGPFMFKSWVPGAAITVVRNPHWYGPKPKASEIVFKIIPNENTLLANAQAHAINVWYFDPIEDVPQLQQITGATVHFTSQPAFEMAVVNLRDPQLANLDVRKALEMAIDRQAIVNEIWKGHATLLAADQPATSWSNNPALTPYPYNPQAAAKLLAAAGWRKGKNGYLQKDGKTFHIVYATTAGNPYRSATERLVLYWLGQLGIQVTIHNYPANEYFGTVLPSGKGWDLGEFEYLDGPDPAFGPLELFTPSGSQDFGGYNNKTVNALFARQAVLSSEAERKPLLQQIETIFHNQLPALWYYSPQEIDTSIGITGYTPNAWSVDTWDCWNWALAK